MAQLVAIDIDGTLVNSQGEITPEVYEAISHAKAYGVHICLCSGRPRPGLQPVIDRLPKGAVEYTVSSNGALVQEVATGKVIKMELLRAEDLNIFSELNDRLGLHMTFFDTEHIYTKVREINGGIARNILTQRCMVKVLDPNEDVSDIDILKIQFLEDSPELIDRLMHEIPKELYNKYYIVRSVIDNLEIMNKAVNKWAGISSLAEYLGVTHENTVGIGDEENDREMLENAGFSVVMENGNESVKELADFITRSNDNSGVAYALEEVIYKRSLDGCRANIYINERRKKYG